MCSPYIGGIFQCFESSAVVHCSLVDHGFWGRLVLQTPMSPFDQGFCGYVEGSGEFHHGPSRNLIQGQLGVSNKCGDVCYQGLHSMNDFKRNFSEHQ